MNAHDNGGPAFPATSWTHDGEFLGENQGMTLRDYFAAKALAGMLADIPKSCYGLDWKNTVTREAYELADAMLKAREA